MKLTNNTHGLINVRERLKKTHGWFDKIADVISAWCGSWRFLILHIIWFSWWLIGRHEITILTFIVSLEAILLMAVLLMSQTRQAERDELRDEADYQADVHAEKMIHEITKTLEKIQKDIEEIKRK